MPLHTYHHRGRYADGARHARARRGYPSRANALAIRRVCRRPRPVPWRR